MPAPYQNPWMLQNPDGTPIGPQDFINAQNVQANSAPAPQPQPSTQVPFSASASKTTPPNMDAMNKLIAQINPGHMAGDQVTTDSLNRLKNYRENMPQGPAGVDLTGLMMLADHFNKNNQFTSAYKAPESGSDRAAKAAGVDTTIAGLGDKISDNELKALMAKMTGETAKLHYGAEKSAEKAGAADKFATHVIDKYNGDKSVIKSVQAEDAANQIQSLLSSGNDVAYQSIPTYMARLSGEVGNLSEADKRPFGGSQALNQRFKQAYESSANGKMTPENIKFISDLTERIKAKSGENKITRAKQYADQYGNSRSGVNPEQVFGYLAPGADYHKVGAAKNSSAGGGFKAGDIQEKDGVQYQRDERGVWSPVK